MNAVYKRNIYGIHSNLWFKTNGPSVTATVLFCFGAVPLSKIAQLKSPRVHSFNQDLSWPYIFVYYPLKTVVLICNRIAVLSTEDSSADI